MIPGKKFLIERLYSTIALKEKQGYKVAGLTKKLDGINSSYDSILEFAYLLNNLEYMDNWPYTEPLGYEDIENEMAEDRFEIPGGNIDIPACKQKAEAAFLSSVAGCILGKPLEVNPTLKELETAWKKIFEWPINDYITEEFLIKLGRRHPSWNETTKENIAFVAPDDDLNYSILGMINLETYGMALDSSKVCETWLKHQVRDFSFGPERLFNACITISHFEASSSEIFGTNSLKAYQLWANSFSDNDIHCGALIRADAYGYAFPGRPNLAAKYACIDASLTHTKTGVYSAMFTAAAISCMFVVDDPMQAFKIASKFIPQKSRIAKVIKLCIDTVENSETFRDAYDKIHNNYSEYTHCKIYQEIGTLINTMKYANNVWDGLCMQVMQGNDTDSYGCTAGSMLGAYFGYPKLDMNKIEIFNDLIHVPLANFYEQSLSKLASRMGNLVIQFSGNTL